MEEIKHNPVGWFEIYVQDMERAKDFYQQVFQFKLTQIQPSHHDSEMEMWGFPMLDKQYGTSGALFKMKDVESGSGGTMVYFSSEDCAVEESRVEAAGGKVVKNKSSIGEYGFISLICDTEGNMIGIHSLK